MPVSKRPGAADRTLLLDVQGVRQDSWSELGRAQGW